MNDLQRQLLADRIDAVERELAYERDLAQVLDRRLTKKEAKIQELAQELALLKEGVDW